MADSDSEKTPATAAVEPSAGGAPAEHAPASGNGATPAAAPAAQTEAPKSFDLPPTIVGETKVVPPPAAASAPSASSPAVGSPSHAAAASPSVEKPAPVPPPQNGSSVSEPAVKKAAVELPGARLKPLAPPPDSPFTESSAHLISIKDEREIGVKSIYMPMPSGVQWPRIMLQKPVAPPTAVLVAKGMIKKFGKREVVRGVDLEVGSGEIVGLLGRNGAGKTTTFRMIMGLLHPDGGTVTYESRDITRLPMYVRANRGIGYLAQQPSVFQRMTVEENLMAILELQVPDRNKRKETLEQLITSLGLATVRKSVASVLSGGERRRLEIARAMSLKPRVILFDEPFAGIDPIAVGEIQGILRELKSQGVGVLLTDHNVRETLSITDRTYIMDEGKIWIHGPPREIVANADARARYLGHDFRLDF